MEGVDSVVREATPDRSSQSADVREIGRRVEAEAPVFAAVRQELARVIVGQEGLIDGLLLALLCNNHVLIEGVPGLAKTLSVTTLARTLQASFQRIQFTPDLLPADLVGTMIYSPSDGAFSTKKGPIFANIVLADEINRAPAKVQSALLEAMQERQVTIGPQSYPLEDPFLVLATQNPIEQEGTYPLPEAQVDRFMLKLRVDYPERKHELQILRRMARSTVKHEVAPVLSPGDVVRLRELADTVYMDAKIEEYIVDLIEATRNPAEANLDIGEWIRHGASPRATIYLAMAARAHAMLQGRGYVIPQDVKSVAPDVLRHRVMVTYEAEAEELTSEDIVQRVLDGVEVP
ncbi:MAG: AAA domain-containing protein [Acidobacteriia bacterium]|nr:AAA domain-containing protein [Terriglobia bacterium]MYG04500.1 AAA domain-containing protein [Terriglobia bacterium]MYK10352.1 AAA domain-containing protein [Terriglobia bacterium]